MGDNLGAGSRPAPVAAVPTLAAETSNFGRSAAVYVVVSLLVRGATLVLTPLYTRTMEPSDFAVVAVANAISSLLAVIFGLDLSGCIPRLSFDYRDHDRRAFYGTLLALSLTVPLFCVGLLYALGTAGHLELFAGVHFRPHLELVVWTSFFNVFVALPLAVYNTREQPAKAALLGGSGALSQLGFTLVLVAWLHQGVVGVLRANVLSAALIGAVSIALMARLSTFSPSMPGGQTALSFSLPLVPHLVANWALAISDRLILDLYVPAADVGRYALAYIFNVLVSVIAGAVGSALAPMAYRQLQDPASAENVPPLGTYAMFLIVGSGLAVALSAGEVISLVAPRSYEAAGAFVPWVVLGAVFQGSYLVLTIGTWFSKRTKPVALITLTAAALNVGLNLLFIPKYGVMVAAVSTAISFAAAAVLHGMLAHRLHPIAWEYRRWAMLFGVALVWYLAGMRLPRHGLCSALAAKAAVAAIAFPASLVACRFFSKAELSRAGQFAASLRRERRP